MSIEIASLVMGSLPYLLASQLPYGRKLISKFAQKSQGLSVIYDGGADLDIVCVHGLGGDFRKTWTAQTSGGKDVNWVQDLLPLAFPNTRIMTYGYKSDHRVIRFLTSTLDAEANQLLVDLEKQRRRCNAHTRPLIFIAHDLGGLIVQNVLAEAGECINKHETNFKTIQLCTIGVLFFGTPQQETNDRTSWTTILSRAVARALEVQEEETKHSLAADADILGFQLDRYRSVEMGIQNYCLYEQKVTKNSRGKVIWTSPKNSIVPNRGRKNWWFSQELKRKYKELVKFTGLEDEGYQRVTFCIRECYKQRQNAVTKCEKYLRMLKDFAQCESPSISSPIAVAIAPDLVEATQYSKQGDYSKAEQKFFKQLDTFDSLGPSVPDGSVIEVLKELARHYVRKGEFEKAEMLYKRIYVMIQEAAGLWSLEAAKAVDSAAQAAEEQGHYQEAEKCLERARMIYDKVLGETHPGTLSTEARIAIFYDNRGKFTQAQELYGKVYEVRRRTRGDHHPETLKVLENMALSYRIQGKITIAEDKLKTVLRLRTASLSSQDIVQDVAGGQGRDVDGTPGGGLGTSSTDRRPDIQIFRSYYHTQNDSDNDEEEDSSEATKIAATVIKLDAVYHDQGESKSKERQKLWQKYSECLGDRGATGTATVDPYAYSATTLRRQTSPKTARIVENYTESNENKVEDGDSSYDYNDDDDDDDDDDDNNNNDDDNNNRISNTSKLAEGIISLDGGGGAEGGWLQRFWQIFSRDT